MNGLILYIGRFELPDKEATANRVINNSKALSDLGYQICLAGWSTECLSQFQWEKKEYFGFTCYEKKKAISSIEKMRMFLNGSPEISLIKKIKPDIIIAYDFPAVALRKIIRYCRKTNIKCIGDVSEWYSNTNKHFIFRLVRTYDSFLRMKILHKKMDGLIVISKYLANYYSKQNIVLIPPLVDSNDEKWNNTTFKNNETINFVYAGMPSKSKERLDYIVKCFTNLVEEYNVELTIIGLNSNQYENMYSHNYKENDKIHFVGRISHLATLNYVKKASYCLIIREHSLKNDAGFPSKFVESISCGTPVITTDISNVKDYISSNENGIVVDINNLEKDFRYIIENHHNTSLKVDNKLFDYKNYLTIFNTFMERIDGKNS